MSCVRWRRVLFLWIDRGRERLPFEPLERHLGECPGCRERAERVERLVSILRSRCGRAAVPSQLVERIRLTIERGGSEPGGTRR